MQSPAEASRPPPGTHSRNQLITGMPGEVTNPDPWAPISSRLNQIARRKQRKCVLQQVPQVGVTTRLATGYPEEEAEGQRSPGESIPVSKMATVALHLSQHPRAAARISSPRGSKTNSSPRQACKGESLLRGHPLPTPSEPSPACPAHSSGAPSLSSLSLNPPGKPAPAN